MKKSVIALCVGVSLSTAYAYWRSLSAEGPAQAAAPARAAVSATGDAFVQLEPGVRFKEAVVDGGMRVWLYAPESAPAANGAPLVVVPPAGSNLMTGMLLGDGDRAEHLPYVRAGYYVVSFDIAGARRSDPADEAAYERAVAEFVAARSGVRDGVAALDRALAELPRADRSKIYLAGHSSAGTLALQMAAEEPRIAAVAAFAPMADLGWYFHDVLGLPQARDLAQLESRSPLALAPKLTRPVLLFHATADGTVPVAQSRNLAAALRGLGRAPTYVEIEGGDHYQAMIDFGIPSALKWLASL